jgi:Sulfatase-modifying factor enzyme 1
MLAWKRLLIFCLLCLLSAWVLSCGEGDDDDAASSDDDDNIADDDDTDDDLNDDVDDDTADDDTIELDCPNEGIIDDYGILWVTIPSGSFRMGCSLYDDECIESELLVREVYVSEYEMTKYMITQEQFYTVMSYNPTNFENCPDCAVDSIEIFVAMDFCYLIGGRLPTEEEWEYAARAGTKTKYYCGDDASCLEGIAWYLDNSGWRPHIVGQKEPNDFCLYDIAGNLHEYTAVGDWPTSLRSGGFSSPAKGLRHSYPHEPDPAPFDNDGIRCVKDIEE